MPSTSPEWKIVASARAARDLRALPKGVAAAVIEFVEGAFRANPQRVGKPLLGQLAGLHSARRGEYRVIYRINEQARNIEVRHIAHRRDAYR